MAEPRAFPKEVSLPIRRAKARGKESQSQNFQVPLSKCLVVWKDVGPDPPRERVCAFLTIWAVVWRKLRMAVVDVVSMFVVLPSVEEIIQPSRVTSCRRRTAKTEVLLFPQVMSANE